MEGVVVYMLMGRRTDYRRFLRARKFDLDGAWNQFKDTEDWRKENAIESLYENIDVDSYEAARRMVSLLFAKSTTASLRSRWLMDRFWL